MSRPTPAQQRRKREREDRDRKLAAVRAALDVRDEAIPGNARRKRTTMPGLSTTAARYAVSHARYRVGLDQRPAASGKNWGAALADNEVREIIERRVDAALQAAGLLPET